MFFVHFVDSTHLVEIHFEEVKPLKHLKMKMQTHKDIFPLECNLKQKANISLNLKTIQFISQICMMKKSRTIVSFVNDSSLNFRSLLVIIKLFSILILN